MRQARALLRKEAGRYKAEKHICGCQYTLFDKSTRVGLVIQGDKVCDWPSGHPAVYMPSRNTVMSGAALQMFYDMISCAKRQKG